MKTDIGEYIVGAYLKIIKECAFIDYNVRAPGGGVEGLGEIDVLGLDFKKNKVYLCEVTTHIRGILYGDYKTTFLRVKDKYLRLKRYALKHLKQFNENDITYMFWSPVVPRGTLDKKLETIRGLELVINEEYTRCINQLREKAKDLTHDAGNPFFRTLQILEHLREI